MRHLFRVENIDRCGQGRKCAILTRKFRYLGPKVNFLFWDCVFCQGGISLVYPWLKLSQSDHPEKNSVSELWVLFRGSTRFLAILSLCHFASISTLNFGPWSEPSKKRPTITTVLVPPGIREERQYLCFFSLKSVFPQKCSKFNKRLIVVWEKGTFLFAQLCLIVARTWRPARSEHIFLGTKTWFSTQKSIFCHTTPNFVYSSFVAPRETVHFPS